jgi:Ca-activated chloride channel family protein
MRTQPIALSLVLAAVLPIPAQDGGNLTIIPPIRVDRPQQRTVRATMTRVQVRIEDGVATTELVQTLHNDGPALAEADWILPLPDGAVADGLTMTVGGKEVAGEVLDATKARGIYEAIVRRMRDPGLLEYVGQGLIRARVFPIPPQGAIDVKVRWRHLLPETAGLHTYRFPLRALGLGERSSEKLVLDLQIRSRRPLKNVWSPLPGVEVIRSGEHQARVGFEGRHDQLPPRDLEVFFGVSAADFGLDLLTWRKDGQPGHFLLMVSPKQDWPIAENTLRVVQFVLDTSGSMQGEKIAQARRALRFFVDSLRPGDLFNVIPFATEAQPFFAAPVAANAENLALARQKIDALEARGGTNIEEALSSALRNALPAAGIEPGKQAVPITVFLTDGLPTIGATDPEDLLKTFSTENRSATRVFVFGVGNDVNTRLLDQIAATSRGDRDYVREGEDLEVKTSALFEKLSHPVLTEVELRFDGIEVTALEPKNLPDLFKGSRLLVLGRYTGSGPRAIRLAGTIDGQRREFVHEATFPDIAHEHDFVGALWAQRRIATLLDAIRLNGSDQELITEVRQLGREYAIVTPYTSHLIVEEGMQIADARGLPAPTGPLDHTWATSLRTDLLRAGGVGIESEEQLVETAGRAGAESADAAKRLRDLPAAPASGAAAVDRSVLFANIARRESVPTQGQDGAASLMTRRIDGRTLVLVGGVWIDRAYRPEMQGKERKIEAFSPAYFEFLHAHPELAKTLAFSTRLVLVLGDEAVEIVETASGEDR